MLAIPGPLELNFSMRGTAESQGSFTAIDLLCEDLLDDEGFLVTLREARGWECQAELGLSTTVSSGANLGEHAQSFPLRR